MGGVEHAQRAERLLKQEGPPIDTVDVVGAPAALPMGGVGHAQRAERLLKQEGPPIDAVDWGMERWSSG